MLSDQILFERLRDVLARGWIPIPDLPGYGGTGAPGILLEDQLGLQGGNRDLPDAGKWELKYHSRSAPLTLFHLEAEPKGHMKDLVQRFGWMDDKGRTSFRHTIWGRSDRGFYVVNESNRISIRNDSGSDIAWPYWTHDKLVNAFVSKLRHLITVRGRKRGGMVTYDYARLYREPSSIKFIEAIASGLVAIDFDARTNNGSGLRNHGTKFRIQYDNLRQIYSEHQYFD